MKNIKIAKEVPSLVKFVFYASVSGTPIGIKTYEDAIEKHPEYFPKEVEHRRKWALVPKQVKDRYFKALSDMHIEIDKSLPSLPSKGILYWCDHPEEYKEWSDSYNQSNPIRKQKAKELHDKYLSPYGIEYNKL